MSLIVTKLKVQNISALIPPMIPAKLKRASARVIGLQVKVNLMRCRRSVALVCDSQGNRKILLPKNTDHHDYGKFLHQGVLSLENKPLGVFFLVTPCELAYVL